MDKITLGNSGITRFIIIADNCCSHGCATDGLVDACEKTSRWIPRQKDLLRNMDDVFCLLWMFSRQAHWCTQTLLLLVLLFAMDAQQTDLLMHMGTVNSCFYCLLWMPQQTDMLLHKDIVNIIAIVIIVIKWNISNIGYISCHGITPSWNV